MHGDVVLYPMAMVELEVDGSKFEVEGAISNSLPMAVLLGTDVPELLELLRDSWLPEVRNRRRQKVMLWW